MVNGMVSVTEDQSAFIDAMQNIDNWMYNHFNSDELELVVRFWDANEQTWMAIIQRVDNYKGETTLITGESTYGSDSMFDAVCTLWSELRDKQ